MRKIEKLHNDARKVENGIDEQVRDSKKILKQVEELNKNVIKFNFSQVVQNQLESFGAAQKVSRKTVGELQDERIKLLKTRDELVKKTDRGIRKSQMTWMVREMSESARGIMQQKIEENIRKLIKKMNSRNIYYIKHH